MFCYESGWRFGEDFPGRPGGIMGKNDLVPLAVVSAGETELR